ncbi:MAG: crossover junction endodeoxyribonuclease RuvC [bacterium]|nr:crossover junction endodeoxyribonuclease RuvC [bacterium]
MAVIGPRIVIGFDTSLRSTGVGVIAVEGTLRKPLYYANIHIPQGWPMSRALAHLDQKITEILEEFKPTDAALEGVYYAKNVRTSMILCHARGVVVTACARRDIPIAEYSPAEIKRAVTGIGSAEKMQVQAMVARILALPPPLQNDAADALAIALTHLHRSTGVLALQPNFI